MKRGGCRAVMGGATADAGRFLGNRGWSQLDTASGVVNSGRPSGPIGPSDTNLPHISLGADHPDTTRWWQDLAAVGASLEW
jgi:hypothetical protein